MKHQLDKPAYMAVIGPDINGSYKVAGWDIQKTGAEDWRCSIIDSDGNYLENQYFETKSRAIAHARQNPQPTT